MKVKDHCKKCGQKLPPPPPPEPVKRFPSYLRGTAILPGIKHAEQTVKLTRSIYQFGYDCGAYTNEQRIEFGPATKACTIPDKLILNLEGTFYLVPLSMRCTRLEKGDQLNFERHAFTFVADDDLKE